ncbi:uncharacterized protein LOC135577933 [Columba livia]|uniref:uncharacterized protein LOC135577933 n=1 Tax=Columba livia TaxID=8932 RepID=UPI0031B9D451
MTDSSAFDKEVARNMLDVVKGNCDFWLVDVPKITSCIHKTLGCINTAPARQSVESLIVWMADKCPGEVVSTLLTIAPPGDSTALALWEVMFSVPQTLQSVLKELLIQLQDPKSRLFCTYLEDHCLVSLAMLAGSDLGDREFALLYMAFRFLKEERPAMLSLVLTGTMTLSQTDEMVSGVSPRAAMVAAPEALPAMVGPGGCLGSSSHMDLVPKGQLSSSYRQGK